MDPVLGAIIVALISTIGAIVAAVITSRSAANVARIMAQKDDDDD